MLQIGDRRVLIGDDIVDWLSAEVEGIHPHPRRFSRRVLASSRFDSDCVAACCQSRDLKQHGLYLCCSSVGVDLTLEHTINKHFGNSSPIVFQADPTDSCAGKCETNLATCVEGEYGGSAAVCTVHIRKPLPYLLDGAAILLHASKRAVRAAGARAISHSGDIERIDPDPALGRLRAPASGDLDRY